MKEELMKLISLKTKDDFHIILTHKDTFINVSEQSPLITPLVKGDFNIDTSYIIDDIDEISILNNNRFFISWKDKAHSYPKYKENVIGYWNSEKVKSLPITKNALSQYMDRAKISSASLRELINKDVYIEDIKTISQITNASIHNKNVDIQFVIRDNKIRGVVSKDYTHLKQTVLLEKLFKKLEEKGSTEVVEYSYTHEKTDVIIKLDKSVTKEYVEKYAIKDIDSIYISFTTSDMGFSSVRIVPYMGIDKGSKTLLIPINKEISMRHYGEASYDYHVYEKNLLEKIYPYMDISMEKMQAWSNIDYDNPLKEFDRLTEYLGLDNKNSSQKDVQRDIMSIYTDTNQTITKFDLYVIMGEIIDSLRGEYAELTIITMLDKLASI